MRGDAALGVAKRTFSTTFCDGEGAVAT